MATIDIIVKSDDGYICGRQVTCDIDSIGVPLVADALAGAVKDTMKDLEKEVKKTTKLIKDLDSFLH